MTGKTGSGKSFLVKQLLLQLQVLNPRIAIVTKGADYRALIELLGGQYREISLRTKLVKNPWDLNGTTHEPDSAQVAGVVSLAFHMAGRTGSDDTVTLNFLEKAVRKKPDEVSTQIKLGQLYLDLKRFDKSLNALRAAERLAPEEKRVHYLLGRLYSATKRRDLAQKEFAIFTDLEAAGTKDK